MPRINRNDLILGMVVAEDVHDRNGRLLLTKGTELGEKHLRLFKVWGILDAEIIGSETDESNKVDEILADRENPLWKSETEKMKNIFRHTNLEHPFLKTLFHYSLEEKVRLRAMEEAHDE